MADPSPRLSAKRPTGRNQPKLPLLIQRDRWIPSRSLFPSLSLSLFHPLHHSIPLPACKKREYKKRNRELLCEKDSSTATHYSINHRSDLLFAFRLLWLNLPSRCSSFTSDQEWRAAVFLPPIHRCPFAPAYKSLWRWKRYSIRSNSELNQCVTYQMK